MMRFSFSHGALFTATVCAALFVSPSAHAQNVTYTDLATFNANTAANRYTETFTTGAAPRSAPSYSFTGNGYSYTVTALIPVTNVAEAVYESGTAAINPNIIGTNNPNDNLIFTFTSNNVTAVGGNFFHTDIQNSFVPAEPVTITLSNGQTVTFNDTSISTFRGFTTTGAFITSLTMAAPVTSGLYASADNFVVGTRVAPAAAPEPGSLVLLGMGLVGGAGSLGITRRRKAATSAA